MSDRERTPTAVPVLEVGGTHVTAALVERDGWNVRPVERLHLDADAAAAALLDRFGQAARQVRAPAGAPWGIAMPDPFDYEYGIALFDAAVAKFGALHGVDVAAALRERLPGPAPGLVFVNDADAFTLGEWTSGAARGAARCVGITLGTGVGSGWLVDGRVVDPGMPPGGRIHHARAGGRPLEDVMSRRAMRRSFAAAGGDPAADVYDIAVAARAGDATALRVLDEALRALGSVVGPLARDFGADVVVIGGSMAGSWDLLAAPFLAGAGPDLPPVRTAEHADVAGLVGAAVHALTRAGG